MKHAFNGLFEFENEEQLETYLTSMNVDEALKLLDLGFNMANRSGVFETVDSHILYLCLKKLKQK